jgi:NitT/TauT family transport system permease protein
MRGLMGGKTVPVLIVLLAIVLFWYVMAVVMNAPWQNTLNGRANLTDVPLTEFALQTFTQDKPVLPAPHQVIGAIWTGLFGSAITAPRSLAFHAGITLGATLLGFGLGTLLGVLLAVVIVHNNASDRSLMPWIIASQTVPILAIAPMVVVGLGAVGVTGMIPKALISMYLSFFPVVVGMVKGLRTPEQIQLDLMRTYNASPLQIFLKLRWPASVPILFASMKVGIAISLIGAVVGELSNNAGGGLGVRLLTGSYNGQTIQIWAALFIAAALAGHPRDPRGLGRKARQPADGGAGMSRLQSILALGALLFAVLTLLLPMGNFGGVPVATWTSVPTLVFLAATLAAIGAFRLRAPTPATGLLAAAGSLSLLIGWVEPMQGALAGFWALLVLTWLLCWLFAEQLSADIRRGRVNDGLVGWLVPVAFGVADADRLGSHHSRRQRTAGAVAGAISMIWARAHRPTRSPILGGRFREPDDLQAP